MEIKKGRLILIISGILALSIVLTASSALALDPPLPGTHWQGPAIRGQFLFEPVSDTDNGLVFSFTGSCGQHEIIIPRNDGLSDDFIFPDDITQEGLLDNVIPFDLIDMYIPPNCEPHLKAGQPDGLLTIQILDWTVGADQIMAQVIMLYIVPQ
jgi:hypothetical protein